MRVVVAPDSFKGSLSAEQAAAAMASGVRRALPDADIRVYPMADGGEGTLATVCRGTESERVWVDTIDPHNRPLRAMYARLPRKRALVELAEASGLLLTPPALRTPQAGLAASTYGTGLVVRHAIASGTQELLLTLGGSATSDGGYGLLAALGAKYCDGAGNSLSGRSADELAYVRAVDLTDAVALFRRAHSKSAEQVSVRVACDVLNPLCGAFGAAKVYGPQKGLDDQAALQRDEELHRFARLLCERVGLGAVSSVIDMPGIGAAGGAALPLVCLAHASLVPGAGIVSDLIGLTSAMQGADLVLTGEGRSDHQTAQGKVPAHIANLAKAAQVPCILLSGALSDGYEQLYSIGVTAAYAASPVQASDTEIEKSAAVWLEAAACRAVQDVIHPNPHHCDSDFC